MYGRRPRNLLSRTGGQPFVPRAVPRSSAAREAPRGGASGSGEPATGGEPRARASRFLSRRHRFVHGTDHAGASFGMTVSWRVADVHRGVATKSAMNRKSTLLRARVGLRFSDILKRGP